MRGIEREREREREGGRGKGGEREGEGRGKGGGRWVREIYLKKFHRPLPLIRLHNYIIFTCIIIIFKIINVTPDIP